MNYQKIYDQIIDRAKVRKLEGYGENHHIIPKCMGGTNKKENIVKLTAREHFICHWILTRIFPSNIKIFYAFSSMVLLENKTQQRFTPSSRTVEYVKEEVNKFKRDTCWVNKDGYSHKIKKQDTEIYLLQGYSRGRGISYNKGKISMVFQDVNRYVEVSQVQMYLEKGYTLGNTNKGKKLKTSSGKGRVCINNGTTTKRVFPQELDYYLKEGWKKGYHYKIDYATRTNYRLQRKITN